MILFEQMYQDKDNPKVSCFLEEFLLFEIYSPTIVHLAHNRWEKLPDYVKDSIHPEIQNLIQEADSFSDTELQKKINAHTITHAVNVLSGYKTCSIPLTTDKSIPTIRKNLLSPRGESALGILSNALNNHQWTDTMAELALRTSHKFLMDMSYYKTPHITKEQADSYILISKIKSRKDNSLAHFFPILQLTNGCLNHCSHCFCNASNHLSYMPYPLWRGLYESLDKYYREYEQKEWDEKSSKEVIRHKFPYSFSKFFHSSDPSHYYDNIMGVDGGDVALWITLQGRLFYFLTKGDINKLSHRAIAKACRVIPLDISFVDTPKENIPENIRLLQKTLHLIHSVKGNEKKGIGYIVHLHLKTPSVDLKKLFPDERVFKEKIINCGRANQFPLSELEKPAKIENFSNFINPDGTLISPVCYKNKYIEIPNGNIFTPQKERS